MEQTDTRLLEAPHSNSSLALLMASVAKTAKLFGPVFAQAWMRLLPLHLLQLGASQFFAYSMEAIRDSGREDLVFIALVAASELIFSLLWSAAWVLAVATAAEARVYRPLPSLAPSFGTEMIRHFNQIVIEQTRAMGAILWRAPLLLVPAIVQYIRLTFVPYITVLDRNYGKGLVDALTESRRLSQGRFWMLTFVVLVGFIGPWMAESIIQGEAGPWIWSNPVGVSISSLLTLCINMALSLLFYVIYRGVVPPQPPENGMKTDADVQLERR